MEAQYDRLMRPGTQGAEGREGVINIGFCSNWFPFLFFVLVNHSVDSKVDEA